MAKSMTQLNFKPNNLKSAWTTAQPITSMTQ
jgi:hypothetical protein